MISIYTFLIAQTFISIFQIPSYCIKIGYLTVAYDIRRAKTFILVPHLLKSVHPFPVCQSIQNLILSTIKNITNFFWRGVGGGQSSKNRRGWTLLTFLLIILRKVIILHWTLNRLSLLYFNCYNTTKSAGKFSNSIGDTVYTDNHIPKCEGSSL